MANPDPSFFDEIDEAAEMAVDAEALAEMDLKGGVPHEEVRAWLGAWARPTNDPRLRRGSSNLGANGGKMRFSPRQMLLAIAALAAIPPSALAQGGSQTETPASAALSTLGSSLSAPQIPASQPATPERLQLMHEYLANAQVGSAMKSIAELRYSTLRAQLAASDKLLPPNQQALAFKALRSAFNAAEERREAMALDEMERYYAMRLTEEELKTVVDFYAHGIGYKSLHNAQHMTPEDRQAVGQFMADHPAMIKFTKLNFDYMKGMSTRQQRLGQAFNEDLKGQFCHNLAASNMKMSTCPTAPQHASRSG